MRGEGGGGGGRGGGAELEAPAAGTPWPGGPDMTSVQESRPLPAASNKPPTPFSIADILGPPARPAPAPAPTPTRDPTSPLCALEELASKTFRRLDGSVLQATEGQAALDLLSPRPVTRRRRKSRTAFTAQQVLELERRFVFQKYLAPAERDGLAARLGLANAQVITWFQNRRAKLKRDVEEMKADVASLRSLPPAALRRLSLSLPESGSSPSADPDPSPDPGPELSDEEIQVDD
ncbi:transcription factor LBX2 [Phascolarctos cinereus]|uniref:Transcription factor LBX2 n=1 Tax=Phascolarctos cinereus TaxID=38626 RepID=A0A6P5LXY6_PHACI|nr:transcription factor LBX2 [Phascolarctos cinereus]